MKSALIIGGSTGVGRGVAEALVESGYDVTVLSRNKPKDINTMKWYCCDLSDSLSSQKILKSVCSPTLSFVCFSAASYGDKRRNFIESEWDFWKEQSTIMIDGLWLTLSITLPQLLLNKGVFLGVSSEVALNFGPGRAGYAACKSAASGLLGSIAQEVLPNEVLIVQMLPEDMVDSPGIRSRRAKDFDYSSYMKPDDFKPFVTNLANIHQEELHGKTVMISKTGGWKTVDITHIPPSQSRRIK